MSWLHRLSNLLRRTDLNREIDEELQFHVDQRIDDNLAAGMTEDEARRDAYARFGSRAGVREATRDVNVFIHVERLWQDLRHGARVFARNPALTIIAILSIACGTGANVAMFSVADAMLLRPLPVFQPSEVLALGFKVQNGPGFAQSSASYLDYEDIRARARSFEGVLAYEYYTVGLSARAGDRPRVRFASFVSDNFFSVLGVDLQLGRGFRADETAAASPAAVVILTDAVWRNDFEADPAVVGRTLRVGGVDFTVIGVAPKAFVGLHAFVRESVFLPIGMVPRVVDSERRDLLEARDARTFGMKARLRPGVRIDEAQAELNTIARALEQTYPATNTGHRLLAQTEFEFKFEQRPLDASLIVLLLTLSIAVLCVSCANVAGLLASRAPVRAREMALRLAIGADRVRLVRQLLTESLGIAVAGGLGGLIVAQLGIMVLRGIQFPSEMIAPPTFELDQRALMFSIAVAMASALLVGLGPAMQTTRVDLATTLKSSEQPGGRGRRWPLRSVLVATQVALSLLLLTVATFAFQTFSYELRNGPGFRTTQMAKVTIDAGQAHYSEAEARQHFQRLLEDARALPGVRSASVTSAMPLFSYRFASIVRHGHVLAEGEAGTPVWANSVDDRYFTTMSVPILAGRPFSAADDDDAPDVAIVNQVLARSFWPDGDAIGKRVQVIDQGGRPVTIVGVAAGYTYGFPGERPQAGIFFPYLQQPRGQMVLLAQTAGESASVLQALRDLAERPDPDVPVFDAQTIERFHHVLVTAQYGTVVRMIAGMGLMGMALTMVGLYGLVSYAVSRRTREIGIRIAIGATHVGVVRMMLRQGMAPVWVGIVVGIVLSAVTSSLVVSLVPVGHQMDGRTYYLVIPIVIAVTLMAAGLPARRAALVSPTVALRCE
jgi:predicted permease